MAAKKKVRSPAFVLDCSVVMAWFFEDETNAYADAVQRSLTSSRPFTPSLWPLEVANSLLVGERRKRTTEAKATSFLRLLRSLPIAADDETLARAWRESLPLARLHNLSVYDATYLELTLRRRLPLATLDGRLKTAAQAAGVKEFKP
jgi:predicted nucleic acid-binding protein